MFGEGLAKGKISGQSDDDSNWEGSIIVRSYLIRQDDQRDSQLSNVTGEMDDWTKSNAAARHAPSARRGRPG